MSKYWMRVLFRMERWWLRSVRHESAAYMQLWEFMENPDAPWNSPNQRIRQ